MGASLNLTGSGTVGDILPGWSVTEDATPVAPGDFSGGTGSVGVTAQQAADSEFVVNNLSVFTHDRLGTISGKVVSVTSNGATEDTDTVVPMTLTTPLTKLAAERTAPPVWYEDLRTGSFAYGTSAAGQYGVVNYTYSIAVDPSDDSIFVASYGVTPASVGGGAVSADKYLVVKYSSTGTYITQFGGTPDAFGVGTGDFLVGPGSFVGPMGVSVSPTTGVVAVSDGLQRTISLFTPNVGRTLYTYTSQFGAAGSGNGQFGNTLPIPVAHDAAGNIYAGDKGNSRIQKFTSTGTYSAQVSVAGFSTSAPYDITFSSSTGLLYATLPVLYSSGGTLPIIRSFSTSLVAQADIPFSYPDQLVVGQVCGFLYLDARADGTIWASSAMQNFAVRINTSGVEQERAYSNNAPSTNVNDTYAITVGQTNNSLYMMDRYIDIGASTSVFTFSEPRVQVGAFAVIQLSEAIQSYIDLIDPSLIINYTAASNPDVFFPGWTGNVWEKLKELCAAYALQIDSVSGVITISDIGTRTVSLDNIQGGSAQLSLDTRATGKSINITYQNASGGQGIMYDAADYDKVFSVGVGETVTESVQTGNYPIELNPISQTSLIEPLPGQYYVIAADNLPVTPEQWVAYGGSVSVAVGAIPGTIDVTLVGPRSVIPGVTAPFSLAVSDGSTSYPAFSVTGAGVFTEPVILNLLTGADPDKTSVEVAADINNFAINTLTQAYDRGIWASVIATGPLLTLNFTVPSTAVSGFGLCQGSLVSFKESTYRITSATVGNVWTTGTATRHVTVGARDAFASGRTVGQHDTLWSGYEVGDEFVKPYRA